MRTPQSEIIEDVMEHIRQCGGVFSEWQVGTARDLRGPFFLRHAAADLGDGLIYREAFTSYAAAEVVDRLKGCGLCQDRASAPPPGDIVFVYRKTPSVLPPPAHDHPPFRKFAASMKSDSRLI